MRAIRFIPLLLLPLLFSCSKEQAIELKDDSYIIFGHYYGMCFGEECVETFKLTSSQLFEDGNDHYAGTGPFEFTELDAQEFEIARRLRDHFPDRLLREESQTFGCPDCSDGGGLYIEYSVDGESKSWRIDQFQRNVPEYLHPFMDHVNATIRQINGY